MFKSNFITSTFEFVDLFIIKFYHTDFKKSIHFLCYFTA